MPRTTSATLGEHFDAFVSEMTVEGRYQSVSKAVRAGLRRLEEDELKPEALRVNLAAGEASPLVEGSSLRESLAETRTKHGWMSGAYALGEVARADLEAICVFTVEQRGVEQAGRYLQRLLFAFE